MTLLLDFSLVAPGGSQTHAIGFLSALAERADLDDLVVVVPGDAIALTDALVRLERAGARILRIRARSGVRSAAARQITIPYLAARSRARAVFCPRETAPLLTPAPLVVLARNVAVWSTHGSERWRVRATRLARRPLAHLTVRRAAAVATVSATMANALPGRAARRSTVIHHGCDLETVTSARLEAGPPASPLRVVALGAVVPHKRYDRLIDHVAALRDLGCDAELAIWGPLPAPDLAVALRDRGRGALGADPVKGVAAPEVRQGLLADADVVAVSSSFESFALPLIEAMTTSCLVWTPRSSLVDELCGDVAVTYPEQTSPARAAQALVDALPTAANRLAAGRARAAAFRWDVTVERTLSLVRSVARTGCGRRGSRM